MGGRKGLQQAVQMKGKEQNTLQLQVPHMAHERDSRGCLTIAVLGDAAAAVRLHHMWLKKMEGSAQIHCHTWRPNAPARPPRAAARRLSSLT
jgi:hypothetical protein